MSHEAIELNQRESHIVGLLTELENMRRQHRKIVPVRIMPGGDQSVDLDNIEEILRRQGIYLNQYGDNEIEGAIDVHPIAPPQTDKKESGSVTSDESFSDTPFSDLWKNLFRRKE